MGLVVALIVALLILSMLGVVEFGELGFLRTVVLTINGRGVTVLDVLVTLVIIVALVALSGVLVIAAGVLLVLWVLSLLGIIVLEGIPLGALIVLAISAALVVHLVTRRRAAHRA